MLVLGELYVEKGGGKFILQCHFDFCNLPISMPWFYQDFLDAWSTITGKKRVLMKTY